MTLTLDQLQITSFSTSPLMQTADYEQADAGISWPDICTCIGICGPTEDLYCTGGCPLQYPGQQY